MLSSYDCTQHAKFLSDNPTWDVECSVVITTSFTQGSCTLTAYRITPEGLDWGRLNKSANDEPVGYTESCFEKVQLLLSDKFLGFFMVPDNEIWNYNYIGIQHVPEAKYNLALANPKDYYNELHRASHFISFAKSEQETELGSFDRDNYFD